MARADFGNVRQRASGRWQARWTRNGKGYSATTDDGAALTFPSRAKAQRWLNAHEEAIRNGTWPPPREQKADTFSAYAAGWLATRKLEVTTADHYAQLIRDHIGPTFGTWTVAEITPAAVRTWYAGLGERTGPVARSHAYQLLRTILATAVDDDLIGANPCRIRGAGRAKTAKRIRPASLDELRVIVAAMPERFRVLVLLATWTSLRFGELVELRRSDVDLDHRVIRIRRAAVRKTGSPRVVKPPKSEAGVRDVTIPPHIIDDVAAHLETHAQQGQNGLLFPSAGGGHLAPSTLFRHFYAARDAAGRPDLTVHGLRHTGQTYAAAMGANLRELMNRAGQSSPGAALRYIHAVDGRQAEIADALSQFATGTTNVTPITAKTPRRRSG